MKKKQNYYYWKLINKSNWILWESMLFLWIVLTHFRLLPFINECYHSRNWCCQWLKWPVGPAKLWPFYWIGRPSMALVVHLSGLSPPYQLGNRALPLSAPSIWHSIVLGYFWTIGNGCPRFWPNPPYNQKCSFHSGNVPLNIFLLFWIIIFGQLWDCWVNIVRPNRVNPFWSNFWNPPKIFRNNQSKRPYHIWWPIWEFRKKVNLKIYFYRPASQSIWTHNPGNLTHASSIPLSLPNKS